MPVVQEGPWRPGRTAAFASALLCLACLLRSTPSQAAGDEAARRSPVVRAVEAAGPAVVGVFSETVVEERSPFGSPRGGDPFFDDFFRDFFGAPPSRRERRRNSHGSGVIVSPDGIVVTNEHVIVRADTIRVQLADQREFEARLVGSDSDADLAVLRIEADEPLPFVTIGDNDSILIGETVIAIGNPFGLSHTVTTGVVSAVGRTFQAGDLVYQDFLQIDASINPGNSGGPLLDVNGRLIGINTAVHRDGQGIGFAIPLWRVRNIVEQILDHGSVLPAWIGLQVQTLTPELAAHFSATPDAGALVRGVEEGSPADLAGLERGVIVTHVQGARVHGAADWVGRVRGLSAGDKLRLRLLANGKPRDVVLDIVSMPARLIDAFGWDGLGIKVAGMAGAAAVRVDELRRGSPADRIGVRPGDLIAGIGGADIASVDDYRKALAGQRGRNNLLLAVIRGRRLYRVTVPLSR
jgi:serine protease Do